MNKKIIFFLILTLSCLSFGEGLTEVTFQILNTNRAELSETTISIGDLTLESNKNGIAKIELFPASYDIKFSKEEFFELNKTFDISEDNNDFTVFLESKFISIDIQAIDELTKKPLQVSIKKGEKGINSDNFDQTNANGRIDYKLEKNQIYNFSINEKNYEYFSFDLDTSNLSNSSFLFKLKRLKFKTNFTFNVDEGVIDIKLKNQNESFKEIHFSENKVSLTLPYGEFNLNITSPDYKEFKKFISINKENTDFNFDLSPNFKTFHIRALLSNTEDLSFNESYKDIEENIVSNVEVKIFSNNSLVVSNEIQEDIFSLDLNYGAYTFEFSHSKSQTYKTTEVTLDENTPSYLLVLLKKKLVEISGIIKNENNLLGGIRIHFKDSEGNLNSTTSNIDGSFNLKLPPKDYTISIQQSGYRLVEEQENKLTELKPNEKLEITLETEEIPSLIKGRITDINGTPLEEVELTLRVNKNEKKYYTNKEGYYNASVKSGLVMMKIYKKGYYSKGTVKKVDKFTTISGVDFKLKPYLSSIHGTLIHKGSPIPDTVINLINTKNEVVVSTISKKNGEFELNNIPVFKDYFIVVEKENFVNYKSNKLYIEREPINNFIINLSKNSFTIVIEIKDTNKNPIPNLEIEYLDKKAVTDINGVISFEILKDDAKETLEFQIPSKNISSKVNLKNQSTNIIKKGVIINTQPKPSEELKEESPVQNSEEKSPENAENNTTKSPQKSEPVNTEEK